MMNSQGRQRIGSSYEVPGAARQGVDVVEVSLAWGDSVLGLVPLGQQKELFVGETSERGRPCAIFLPEEILGSRRHRLLFVDAVGSIHVSPPHAAQGWVRLPNEMQLDLSEMGSPAGLSVGDGEFVLPRGARVLLTMGDFALSVRAVGRAEPLPGGFPAREGRVPLGYFGLSLAVFAGLFGALAYVVPPLGLSPEADSSKERLLLLQQYMASSALREREEPKPVPSPPAEAGGARGEGAAGDPGQLGAPKKTTSSGRFAVQRTESSEEEVALMRLREKQEAANFGMSGLLRAALHGDLSAPLSPWGADVLSGRDASSANGNMWADALGDAPGGGLGLSGWGEGGGLTGRWVGLAGVGTVGTGLRDFGPGGFGSSSDQGGGSHKVRVPRVTPQPATTSGRLPAEVVQRTVRQNFGRFRMCYQSGLARNPGLEGRVSVRFVIGRDGAVSNVGLVGAGMADGAVNDCLRASFYGISFTPPENGIVQVTYPLLFSPE